LDAVEKAPEAGGGRRALEVSLVHPSHDWSQLGPHSGPRPPAPACYVHPSNERERSEPRAGDAGAWIRVANDSAWSPPAAPGRSIERSESRHPRPRPRDRSESRRDVTLPWTIQSVHGYPERTSDREH